MNPRDYLTSAGYLPKRTAGHSPEVLRALEAFPCEVCKKPVGAEGRGSKVCMPCVAREYGK